MQETQVQSLGWEDLFHSGKTLNLLSGQEKEDALWDATANIPGLLLIMSHAHPWTHHWGQEGE